MTVLPPRCSGRPRYMLVYDLFLPDGLIVISCEGGEQGGGHVLPVTPGYDGNDYNTD